MKYGQIAENQSINVTIYRCFEYICEQDALKFVKKFREQPHEKDQVMHTFRELIVGAFLASNAFNVRYDQKVDGKTPDWCVLDINTSSLQCIVELVNLHIDRIREDESKRLLDAGQIWWNWAEPNNARLYQRILEKANTYEKLAKKNKSPYVVSVFSEFTADVKLEELNQCLFGDHGGLFNLCPTLSGVLFFKESSGWYFFTYIRNPQAILEIEIPSGVF